MEIKAYKNHFISSISGLFYNDRQVFSVSPQSSVTDVIWKKKIYQISR